MGTGAITVLALRVARYGSTATPAAAVDVWEHTRIQISFDGRAMVDAPLGEFYGSGLGPARVRSLMFGMDGTATGWATSWWPMPFATEAVITLINESRTSIASGRLHLTWTRNPIWRRRLASGTYGYFHAFGTAERPGRAPIGAFRTREERGTSPRVTLTMAGALEPLYLEGNERAYVDGAQRPQIQGTGTEDFFDAGWYSWDHPFTLPLSGLSADATLGPGCRRPSCKTAYRLGLADRVSFQRSLRYEIQHEPENNVRAIYSSTAYWYQPTRESAAGRDAVRPASPSAGGSGVDRAQ